jgi:hypothetical protein
MDKSDGLMSDDLRKAFFKVLKDFQKDISKSLKDLQSVKKVPKGRYQWQIRILNYESCDRFTGKPSEVSIQTYGTLAEAFRSILDLQKQFCGATYIDLNYEEVIIAVVTRSGDKILLPFNLWEEEIHQLLHELRVEHALDGHYCRLT